MIRQVFVYMDNALYITIILISVVFSAFFSGMEIAFVSANRLKVEMERKHGGFIAKIVSIFTNNPSQFIATMLIGNNIALVVYGIFFARFIEAPLKAYVVESELAVLLIQTIISTIIILITAEFLPKTIFRRNANSFLNIFSLPVWLFYFLFYPISKFTVFLSEAFIEKVFKVKPEDNTNETVFGKVDLSDLLYSDSEHSDNNTDEDNQIKLFKNALEFSDVTIRECMVPRNEIVAVSSDAEMDEVKQKLIETGFSKIPVYLESIDNIIGYVHTMNVIKNTGDIKESMTRIPAIPESMYANEVLQKLIKLKKSVALVVDEFGGTSGMVTIEDIIEEIFGEIEDEHDKAELYEKKLSDTEYVFSGRLEVDYINSKYKFSFPESEEYETVAGYILSIRKEIPKQGDIIEEKPFKFEILKTDYPKILRVRLLIEE